MSAAPTYTVGCPCDRCREASRRLLTDYQERIHGLMTAAEREAEIRTVTSRSKREPNDRTNRTI
jgi:hypothetical protein